MLCAVMLTGAAVACVIDLDPPADPADAGLLADQQADATPADASDASDARRDTGGVECVQNSDCRSEPGPGVGCVETTCDLKAGRCVYDFCPSGGVCKAKSCDVEAGVCGAESTVKFVASELTFATDSLMKDLPCAVGSINLSRCFAASHPFLFVAHQFGTSFASAYPVVDLAVTTPQPIPIEGIDFPPAIVIQSGSLVYFIGKVQMLTGTSGLLPIAWLEAPRDPRAVTMKATKVTAQYNAPPTVVPAAFAAPGGAIVLTSTTTAVLLQAPLAEKELLLPIPPQLGMAQGAPVAQSRDRLVFVNQPANGNANGQLVRNAGTTAGSALTPQSITTVIGRSVPGQSTYAYTPEGTVMSLTSRWADGDASTPIDSVRVASLIGSNQVFATASTAGITLVSFEGGIPMATKATGPLAAVDTQRTVALALEPPSATFAQLVELDDAGTFRPLDGNRREVFDGGPATFAAQTSSGWVYVLQQTAPMTVTVRILQPSCDASP